MRARPLTVPTLQHGETRVRAIRSRDAKALEREQRLNWNWLKKWQATLPGGNPIADARASIRWLQQSARHGHGLPFVVEVGGEFAGQVNVSNISYGSIESATIGYWISERCAGRGIMPTAVALVTDHCFTTLELHRIEINIRTENKPSLRVVEKLGFRYEGLRQRYIHINGDWRDHHSFALVKEDVPEGVLERWLGGEISASTAGSVDERLPETLPFFDSLGR